MGEHQSHHPSTAGIDEEDDLHRMVVMHRWVCGREHRWVCGREHWDEEGCPVDDLMRRSRC